LKKIEDVKKWSILKAAMIEKGYAPYIWQYSINQEEGLHIWFYKKDSDVLKRVEVVTHNKIIANDIQDAKW
jgi:hypothetical protein